MFRSIPIISCFRAIRLVNLLIAFFCIIRSMPAFSKHIEYLIDRILLIQYIISAVKCKEQGVLILAHLAMRLVTIDKLIQIGSTFS